MSWALSCVLGRTTLHAAPHLLFTACRELESAGPSSLVPQLRRLPLLECVVLSLARIAPGGAGTAVHVAFPVSIGQEPGSEPRLKGQCQGAIGWSRPVALWAVLILTLQPPTARWFPGASLLCDPALFTLVPGCQ